MAVTTISSKYQVVIPKEVRSSLHLKSGQKMHCLAKGGIVYLVPRLPIAQLRGMAKGISIEGYREKKDRV